MIPTLNLAQSLTSGPIDVASAGDPHFSNVVTLLHFNAADGSTTYTDQIAGMTWDRNAGLPYPEIKTTQFRDGASSLRINQHQQIISNNGASLNWPAKGTLEGSFYIDDLDASPPNNRILITKDGGSGSNVVFEAYVDGLKRFIFYHTSNGAQYDYWALLASANGSIVAGQWYDWCVEKDDDVWRLYLNGNLITTTTTSGSPFTNNFNLAIGAKASYVTRYMNGYVDKYRWTHNVARYGGSNYTPGPFYDS